MEMNTNKTNKLLLTYIKSVKECLRKIFKEITSNAMYDINYCNTLYDNAILYDQTKLSELANYSTLKAEYIIEINRWYKRILTLKKFMKQNTTQFKPEIELSDLIASTEINNVEKYLEDYLQFCETDKFNPQRPIGFKP